jgi:dTDP-4-dehydrorhamnose 3,5-epimerase
LVRCVRGAIFDVLVDLRQGSPTYGHWAGLTLDDQNRDTAYVPVGFAHGYQTLTDDAELLYIHSALHAPGAEGGLNHADPSLSISWPLPPKSLSARDTAFPLLADLEALTP